MGARCLESLSQSAPKLPLAPGIALSRHTGELHKTILGMAVALEPVLRERNPSVCLLFVDTSWSTFICTSFPALS